MSARLTAGFWVAAYRARLEAANVPVYVTARGDDTAGAVVVKCALLDGTARLHARVLGPEGAPVWEVAAEGPEADVDAAIARRRRSDPDLWVVEIEDRAGRTMLDEPGLD